MKLQRVKASYQDTFHAPKESLETHEFYELSKRPCAFHSAVPTGTDMAHVNTHKQQLLQKMRLSSAGVFHVLTEHQAE
jgi:hypothetical protein